jgi:hypothetical protein
MKYIRDYKLFESKAFDDIKTDVEGILVELLDKGFSLNVYEGVFIYSNANHINTFRVDSNVEGITIRIENSEIYKTSDIEDYILTVIDYIKIEWDISEVVIYDTGRQPQFPEITGYKNWCNMSTEFSIKLGINRWSWFKLNNIISGFAISIKKV